MFKNLINEGQQGKVYLCRDLMKEAKSPQLVVKVSTD